MRQHRLALESPHCRLREIPLTDVRWTEGFWAERFALCQSTILPSMRRAMDEPENGAVFSNFYVAAGRQEGQFRGTDWSDGDCYKWMEAAAVIFGVTRDSSLDLALDELIEVIGQAQDADGYICTQIQLTDKERWTDLRHHELYNMGHLFTAASVHHQVTGKQSFLQIAVKLADYLYEVFEPRPPELAHFGFNPSHIMGLVDLYRVTGESRYLELAGIFVSMRGSAPGGTDQNQTRVPLRQETEAVGHAVTASYLYAGATDVYAETGEAALRDALERIWNDVTGHKTYITGGTAALHRGTSKRGDLVWEAYGHDYQLPNATAYNETCANIGSAMWNWRMLGITAEAKYADEMERVIYNSMLSAMSIDGTHFFYTNPLRWYGKDHELLSNDARERWYTWRCYCCPPQVARTIARMHQWAYSLSEDGLWVHLYGGNTLETQLGGALLKVTQDSDYPWEGHVKLTLDAVPQEPFTVRLRTPAWAAGARVLVNGQGVSSPAHPGDYAALTRSWVPGDVIELHLPMDVRMVYGHPRVEEVRNHIALMRGPVVYCLESADLPEGVTLPEVRVPANALFASHHEPDLLGGVTVLEGQGLRVWLGVDSDELYRSLGRLATKPVCLRLVPYYAWANRGITEMSVWLPMT